MKHYFFILFFLLAGNLNAQVCVGNLGDPTVEINFGTGSSVGPPLSSQNTSYSYKNSDCPTDGFYVINNKTSGCFNSTWHMLAEDHTQSDNNGYMMIVNATVSTGVFYAFDVNNLCPNTTYEFSSYIINLLKPNAPCGTISRPNIRFIVETEDGQVLQTYGTGSIGETSTPQWNKYGFFFNLPNNVSKVVLKLQNIAPGGCGNDLALDDITFRPCGPTIIANDVASNNANINICEGNSKDFTFKANVSQGYSNPAFVWQIDEKDGSGWKDIPNTNSISFSTTINDAKPAGYQYRLAAAEAPNIGSTGCRVYSNPISINVVPKFVVNAGDDIYVLENAQAQMMATAPPNLTYLWTPTTYLDNPAILQPKVSPKTTTTYQLIVTDETTGCTTSDEVTVFVDLDIKIPDSFTPNGDGINDSWAIKGLTGDNNSHITIFNRHGQIVYESIGYQKEFDGKFNSKALPPGMYYYLIDTKSVKRPVYKGSLMIIY